MTRRVALLRAINVGGTGRLKMDALRALAAELGFTDIETEGASGNLVYTSNAKPAADVQALGAALSTLLDKKPTVIVRDASEIQALIASNPFAGAPDTVPDKWRFIGFLEAPTDIALPDIPAGAPYAYARRRAAEIGWVLRAADRHALDLPKQIERATGLAMTARNWNVVRKLAAHLG